MEIYNTFPGTFNGLPTMYSYYVLRHVPRKPISHSFTDVGSSFRTFFRISINFQYVPGTCVFAFAELTMCLSELDRERRDSREIVPLTMREKSRRDSLAVSLRCRPRPTRANSVAATPNLGILTREKSPGYFVSHRALIANPIYGIFAGNSRYRSPSRYVSRVASHLFNLVSNRYQFAIACTDFHRLYASHRLMSAQKYETFVRLEYLWSSLCWSCPCSFHRTCRSERR